MVLSQQRLTHKKRNRRLKRHQKRNQSQLLKLLHCQSQHRLYLKQNHKHLFKVKKKMFKLKIIKQLKKHFQLQNHHSQLNQQQIQKLLKHQPQNNHKLLLQFQMSLKHKRQYKKQNPRLIILCSQKKKQIKCQLNQDLIRNKHLIQK